MNIRGFTWLDESIEHSDQDVARAEALMRRWSQLHYDEEQERFSRQVDEEEGRCYDWEPEPCEVCGGLCVVGVELPTTRRGRGIWPGCGDSACPNNLVGIKCPSPDCQDGYDVGPIREAEQRERERREDRELEVELIEDKLRAIGARPMRPYEHWNEDEAYVQYQEEGRFGEYSR